MDSLPLFHSWALFDAQTRMAMNGLASLGADGPAHDGSPLITANPQARHGIGLWSCDLSTNRLSWTPEVYALFGIPENEPLVRGLPVSCYVKRSRIAMEMLRAHAIDHRRGFTLDAMIRRPDGDTRWMRLSAMPILQDGKVVRLCGTKEDVTADYDGPGWLGF